MAYRVDIGELRPAVRLEGGRLRVEGRIARAGIQIYHDADGNEIREYRPPDEVFDSEAMRSFDFSVVTDDHPGEMVTAQNARALGVGLVVESVRRGDEKWLTADMVINDADMIAKLEAGKVQLSCGYHADVELTGGVTPEGEKYDAIQKNIRGNHIAIVDNARAGSAARVRLDDSGNAFLHTIKPTTETRFMADSETLKSKYDAALADAAEQKARADRAEERADRADAGLASEKERADKAEAKFAELKESIPARVAARVDLEMKAHPVLDEEDKAADFSKMTDREIRIAVIEKLGGTVPENKRDSDAYVEARFDSKLESAERGDGFDALRTLAPGAGAPPARPREDEFDEAAAARRMEERADARWMGEDKE